MKTNLEYTLIVFNAILIIVNSSTFLKNYFGEKGKNLATKQDIKRITDEIESIKNLYNASLEDYKMKLLERYDSLKSHIETVNRIDNTLINLLLELNDLNFTYIQERSINTENLTKKLEEAAVFILKYKFRYSSINSLMEIINQYNSFNNLSYTTDSFPDSISKNLDININDSLSCLLPKISIDSSQIIYRNIFLDKENAR
ncbi:hypothetical protein [uncultured Bacteroides sp.]|uniref:hypothetical protein n=1 Tax=uncultured Bacteroides sp. TaxID=162156 RepID=UPI002AAB6617|nr:hypothetical protein [uncultured Bacteroides sp.]